MTRSSRLSSAALTLLALLFILGPLAQTSSRSYSGPNGLGLKPRTMIKNKN